MTSGVRGRHNVEQIRAQLEGKTVDEVEALILSSKHASRVGDARALAEAICAALVQ